MDGVSVTTDGVLVPTAGGIVQPRSKNKSSKPAILFMMFSSPCRKELVLFGSYITSIDWQICCLRVSYFCLPDFEKLSREIARHSLGSVIGIVCCHRFSGSV